MKAFNGLQIRVSRIHPADGNRFHFCCSANWTFDPLQVMLTARSLTENQLPTGITADDIADSGSYVITVMVLSDDGDMVAITQGKDVIPWYEALLSDGYVSRALVFDGNDSVNIHYVLPDEDRPHFLVTVTLEGTDTFTVACEQQLVTLREEVA